MAKLRIVGQSKIGNIKARFREVVGVNIEIYDADGNPADDNVTFGSIRTKAPESTEIDIVGQTLVKNVEAFFCNKLWSKDRYKKPRRHSREQRKNTW